MCGQQHVGHDGALDEVRGAARELSRFVEEIYADN